MKWIWIRNTVQETTPYPPDLLGGAAAGGVGDGPGRLLSRLELRLRLDLYQDGENVGIYHCLQTARNNMTIIVDGQARLLGGRLLLMFPLANAQQWRRSGSALWETSMRNRIQEVKNRRKCAKSTGTERKNNVLKLKIYLIKKTLKQVLYFQVNFVWQIFFSDVDPDPHYNQCGSTSLTQKDLCPFVKHTSPILSTA